MMGRNLLLGLVFVLCLVSFIYPSLCWWNESWQYRRPITIDNSGNSNDLTNYQILVVLNSTNFDFSKANSDGSDIRFIDSDDTTKLNYWIEEWNSTAQEAKIWVNVTSIPASSTKTIYMYYGNPSATSESNGSAVFDFFDDASSDKTDEYTRTAPYSWSYGEGYLTWNSGYYTGNITTSGGATYWVHSTQVPENFSFYAKVKDPHTSDNTQVGIAIHGNTENILARRVYAGTTQVINLFREDSSGSYKICESNIDATNTNWHKLEMKKFGNTWKIYYDDSEICSGTYTPADSNYQVSLYIAWNSNTEVYWDDIRVRKYTDPEPTTSVGSEQSVSIEINIYSPEAKTYWTTDIEFTFNVTGGSNLTVKAFINNQTVYENENYEEGELITLGKLAKDYEQERETYCTGTCSYDDSYEDGYKAYDGNEDTLATLYSEIYKSAGDAWGEIRKSAIYNITGSAHGKLKVKWQPVDNAYGYDDSPAYHQGFLYIWNYETSSWDEITYGSCKTGEGSSYCETDILYTEFSLASKYVYNSIISIKIVSRQVIPQQYDSAVALGYTRIFEITTIPKLDAGNHTFKVWAKNEDNKTSEKTIDFSVEDYEIEAIEYNETAYETSSQNFKEIIRVNWDLVSNITANLIWNGTDKGTAEYSSNSTHIILSKTIAIPLIQENNTEVSFYFQNTINYANGNQEQVDSDTYNQTITFAYWIDSVDSDKDNYIEREDATIYVYVKDLVGNADLAVNVSYMNQTETASLSSSAGDLKTFSAIFDTGEANQSQETRNFTAYLTITFQGESRIVNLTGSLNVYKIVLTNCSASSLSQTKALEFFLKDEETDDAINGDIEVNIKTWKTGEITRTYAFSYSGVSQAGVCIYPTWAEYQADAMLVYEANNYTDRSYYLSTEISQDKKDVYLYLLSQDDSSEVIFKIKDSADNPIEGAIVKILRFYVGENAYKTVAQLKTDYEGKGITYLKANDIYYKYIVEKDGEVLKETNPTLIICPEGYVCPPYYITLKIITTEASVWDKLENIAYSCEFNNETNVLRCTVTDTQNIVKTAYLKVEEKKAISWETVCNVSADSSGSTLVCELGNTTNKLYWYWLGVKLTTDETATLYQDYLNFQSSLFAWGVSGLVIALVIILTMFFIGIWNPSVAIILGTVGTAISWLLGLLPITYAGLVGLVVVAGILIYKLKS